MSNNYSVSDDFRTFLDSKQNLDNAYGTTITLEDLELINCTSLPMSNISLARNDQLTPEQTRTLEQVYRILYLNVIPAVCVFGFFGNVLNVIVFSKKRIGKTLDEIEYCTTIFLLALAISDMMFCVCTFPQAFDDTERSVFYKTSEFMLYYKMYSNFAISTFILSSTLLTVTTAILRYTGICHPFHSRQFISFRKTVGTICVLFAFSAAFNLPFVWRYKTVQPDCDITGAEVRLEKSDLFTNPDFNRAHRILWVVIGNFIPLIILMYCNVRLVNAIHQSQRLRLLHCRDHSRQLSAHRRINITLITIIILFFILVAPSEISKFISYVSNSKKYSYYLVSMITNALQCINFSVNFVLYYVIIAPFRKTIHDFVRTIFSRRGVRDFSNTPKQSCIAMTLKDQRRTLIRNK